MLCHDMLLGRFSETKTLKVWPGSANIKSSLRSLAVGKGALLTAFNKETDGFSIRVITRRQRVATCVGLAFCLHQKMNRSFFR